jgi:hypothetical protein
MRLPSDVVAAKLRMELADAALRADIESDQPTSRERRIQLIDELQSGVDFTHSRLIHPQNGLAEDSRERKIRPMG